MLGKKGWQPGESGNPKGRPIKYHSIYIDFDSEERGRDWRLHKKYHINIDDYYALLEAQLGVCAICGKPETHTQCRGKNNNGVKKLGSLAVDHDHKTGTVRGLLCHKCNTIFMPAFENDTIRNNATNYLRIGKCITGYLQTSYLYT